MTDARKKLFGLFKSHAAVEEPPKPVQNHDRERKNRRERPAKPHPPRLSSPAREREDTRSPQSKGESSRKKDEHVKPKGEHTKSPDAHIKSKETHVKSYEAYAKSKGGPVKGKERLPYHKSKPLPEPLTEWPPSRLKKTGNLSQEEATELITTGAPIFVGKKRLITHASDEYYNLYATCRGNRDAGTDCGDVFTTAFEVDSMPSNHTKTASHPWETLEQPSMAFYYGTRAGEVTLNHWVSMARNANPPLELRDSGVNARTVELSTVLNRLIFLESGFEEDYEELMYKNLYGNLLRDPDKFTRPHKQIESQISDLILVLSRPDWIDFSLPQNQVVAKFFASASYADQGMYKMFFHQLLLSMELYYRIHSKHFTDQEKEILIDQLPPRISWNLAVARKWKECIKIEKFTADETIKQIRFHLREKKTQVKALRRFARAMKWPNLVKVDEVLKERDIHAIPLEDRSSDAMSYFTGMILPGITMPWLIMNTLIDCDVDAGVNALAALTHMHPNSGFQYRSTTYWSTCSIVGKVLAPTCRSIGGWIGPARPAPDLGRIQIARIRQRSPENLLSPEDVLSMSERSDPLGPTADAYPVEEYSLILPEIDPHNLVDSIRIEKLALRAVSPSSTSLLDKDKSRPQLYDAAVQFAIDGESWPLRLSYDVSFISACPCARGPHPLFFDYVYQTVKIDQLLQIRHWGSSRSSMGSTSTSSYQNPNPPDEKEDTDKVLVIEAFGVPDNEVLARAYCAHWALGAVVADMERTCLGCAVREAYAACVNVVILIEALDVEEDK